MDHYVMLPTLHASGLVKAPQVLLLGLLTANNEGTSHTDLMVRTGLPAAHISTCLAALEKAWLVERRYPLRDGRTINVYLTAPGTRRAEVMLIALQGQKVAVATGMQET